tara:strand:- start:2449 stop:2694 length:246 start_codon:yes stop_codon:yes gene_type:complete
MSMRVIPDGSGSIYPVSLSVLVVDLMFYYQHGVHFVVPDDSGTVFSVEFSMEVVPFPAYRSVEVVQELLGGMCGHWGTPCK